MMRKTRREFLRNTTRMLSTAVVANIGIYAVGAAFKNLDGDMKAYGWKMCSAPQNVDQCIQCCAYGAGQAGFDMAGCAMMCQQSYSDERLKTNIQLVGQKNGYNIYEFEYISDAPEGLGDGQRYQGIMAQEVLKKDPSSVVLMPNGFYAVKYAHIGIEFKKVSPVSRL